MSQVGREPKVVVLDAGSRAMKLGAAIEVHGAYRWGRGVLVGFCLCSPNAGGCGTAFVELVGATSWPPMQWNAVPVAGKPNTFHCPDLVLLDNNEKEEADSDA